MEYTLEDMHSLLRLNFAPQHIVDGKVLPTAISTEDLKSRGYSLDAEPLINADTLTERAQSQSEKDSEARVSPYISRFQYCDANSIKIDDTPAFNIFHSPVALDREKQIKANPAHVSLLCTDSEKGKPYYRKARILLLPLLQNLIELSAYLEKIKTDETEKATADQ
ncbi:hypothetical protein [Pseudomonas sp. S3_E11]